MKTISPENLSVIRKNLMYGDQLEISKALGTTVQYVNKVLKSKEPLTLSPSRRTILEMAIALANKNSTKVDGLEDAIDELKSDGDDN